MFISLYHATGGLSLPSHDTLAVWAKQSTFLERSLVHSVKRCCLQERLNNDVFCSRIFLLCTPLKHDHIPNIATDTGICHAVSQPKQTESLCDCRPRFDYSTNFLFIIICQCYIGSFMPVLHLVRIMPSYSRKTINRMHTKINIGNYWLHCDVTLFMLKLKCLVAQLHLGLCGNFNWRNAGKQTACSNLSCTLVLEEGCQKFKRLSYTANFEREIIRCAEDKGNRKAAAIFGVDESNVRLWR